MIDDSLSDTQQFKFGPLEMLVPKGAGMLNQQENKMSVKELILTDTLGSKLSVKFESNELAIEFKHPDDDNAAWLDRNQAHLLMLYLQEYLK